MTSKHPPLDASVIHVAGESEFIDDRAFLSNELVVGMITSDVAHGTIEKINVDDALKIMGVIAIYTAKDLVHNCWGTIIQDQPVLADREVNYVGEPICIIACESNESLRKAKRMVSVKIKEKSPILSISDARKRNSFIASPRFIERGDVESAFKTAPHCLNGRIQIGGQEHFYLESQCAIAYPKENGQIEVHSSSQHPSEVQHMVAHSLGLKFSDVVCIVKRMGGGFGGKESQAGPFATLAALVAYKIQRPARLVISKDEDMIITGKRNPFENEYEVAFDDTGRILALKIELYSDAGAYADLSTSILERAMLHCDNAYYLEHVKIKAQICRTNFAPTTAFRGFGGPKGVATIENIIEEIACFLKKDSLDIRQLNCYQSLNNRNITPYGQTVDQDILPRLFKQLREQCNYDARRKEVNNFNSRSKTHIKGLSLTAVKFGISFTTRFLNQASALVNLHLDGTVQVSTGATEMGQGVNTKIAQVVAQALSIAPEQVRLMPTSTEKNHNTSPTAASSGSDLNGRAALVAVEAITHRLKLVALQMFDDFEMLRGRKAAGMGINQEIVINEQESSESITLENGLLFKKSEPQKRFTLVQVIEEAYLNRISLGAYGFYQYPGIHFNKETGTGNPFFYFTNGVAASEVSIDLFTGEVKVLQSDILMDLGRRLNAGIDYGQTCGAFVQGMGWVTTERLYYNEKGALKTFSPSTYKIPSVQDTPRVFRINFLENDENQKNLKGSKAVGEPPLLLGISVWTAIKNALTYLNSGRSPQLRIPATQEEILSWIPNELF